VHANLMFAMWPFKNNLQETTRRDSQSMQLQKGLTLFPFRESPVALRNQLRQ